MMNSALAWQIAAGLACAAALLVIVNIDMPEPLRIALMIIDVVASMVVFGLLVATALRQRNG
ncbi:hypothetical protein [Nonomuraea sp. CA-141351]|uniref:hypothetical protein n=1 Tax=Nonomuraea sp. CA-141351 TaxID=3239996 RepID=UPI003D8B9094